LTIAACYLSTEGVILGADSTTTYSSPGGSRYFNHAQKLFEVGEASTMGIVTWGLGTLVDTSYRRLFALLADDLEGRPPASIHEAARRWSARFWAAYTGSGVIGPLIGEYRALARKAPFDPAAAGPDAAARTPAEQERLEELGRDLVAGFCIGGYVMDDREPAAYSVIVSPEFDGAPEPVACARGFNFWGAPNMIHRLIAGYDQYLVDAVLSSGKWSGDRADLERLLEQFALHHQSTVPLRETVDFVHACIVSTIKALKFSYLSQICGGPIEIAVITADRPFRWVRHKAWDSAIMEGTQL
jgi:hypothetical protein